MMVAFQTETEPLGAPLVVYGKTGQPWILGCQGRLGLLNDGCKSGLVIDSHVGQNFSIELNGCFLRAGNKGAVAKALLATGGIDACDPESAEFALACAAVAIG